MKKFLLLIFALAFLAGPFIPCPALADPCPGLTTVTAVTAVTNTTTASGGTLIIGSTPNQADPFGGGWMTNTWSPSKYQVWPADFSSTILYAYSNSPTAWMQWPAVYGPLQVSTTLPNGLWVGLTPTSGVVNVYFDPYH